MPCTVPLTLGFHALIAPVVALNENALFRVTLAVPGRPTWVNVPTAYIVVPHWTSLRTYALALVTYGVQLAAVVPTVSPAAAAGVIAPNTAVAVTTETAINPRSVFFTLCPLDELASERTCAH